MPRPALLVLEDGASFAGEALTGSGTVGGELVFTTSMAGYQEVASDPSYHGQIIVYTFPMVGNYGVAPGLDESSDAAPPAIVAREITNYAYNRVAETGWLAWLAGRGILAVTGVDTRAVTRHIRELGALRAVISTETGDVDGLRAAARRVPAMGGRDLAAEVTCREAREIAPRDAPGERFHVVVVDLGVKRSILDLLLAEGCRLTVVPASMSAKAILKMSPDGVLLSNGPGDPAAVTYAVKTARRLLGSVPVFGICLGHQLLALALGLETFKLPFGHRGVNHPVKDVRTGRVEITTQNHGFAVAQPGRLPPGVELTHLNLNDGTVEGLADASRHAFSLQYHPEASPGPHDARHFFSRFAAEMDAFRVTRPANDVGRLEARGRKGRHSAATKPESAGPAAKDARAPGPSRVSARILPGASPEERDERHQSEAGMPDHDSESRGRGKRSSLRDALRGHLGDPGRKEW
jgi:carbamoyl-phosphate synthase small subunit